ncbi:TolC family protein [Flammeovirga aprica]|uniref:TolC family protein n=1 Tax=Flammeovirga aprica JL-4 TaxID=694437 RepID=A0A7X9P160_9BACT|nr:TolC family protein [Flammeovirga aprica]NME67540.1 TolC family protein [Flammeovirga aprica JL-4]
MKKLSLLPLLLFVTSSLFGQKVLSLKQAINLAQANSNYVQIAGKTLEIERANFKSFQTDLRPQMVLKGTPTSYGKNYNPITQPDGSVVYQAVEQNNINMQLNLTQQIAATGGSIFIGSQINRFDNFQASNHQYQAQPFYIGYNQPIFQYNQLKWQKKLAPLQLQEAEKQFIEDMEWIAVQTTQFYFDALVSQLNSNIALQNVEDNKKIVKITKAKKEMGRASESEVLQVELNVITAEQTYASANLSYRTAMRALLNYLQVSDYDESIIQLLVPSNFNLSEINTDQAWEYAKRNRKDFINYQRRMMEGESQIAKAKRDNRFQANVEVAFGLSNQSQDITQAYSNNIQSQQFNVTLAVPILDWGRAKARINAAVTSYELTQAQIEQDKLDFQREVINASEQLETMAEQVNYIQKADEVAQKKYSIALQRYELGDINIRELVWSTDEKDQAKNAYINTLKSYWVSYYQLRTITLYDFEERENIRYVIQ